MIFLKRCSFVAMLMCFSLHTGMLFAAKIRAENPSPKGWQWYNASATTPKPIKAKEQNVVSNKFHQIS